MPARFLYARFVSGTQKAAVDWNHTVEEFARVYTAGAHDRTFERSPLPAGPAVTWRLVSENRREIARACRLYTAEQQVRADIARLLRGLGELQVHSAPAPRLRSTGWFVTHDGVLVMMGARRYEKRSAAEQAAALALRAIGEIAALGSSDPGSAADPTGTVLSA